MSDTTIPFFVGSYTMPAGHVKYGHGKGVYSCELDTATGEINLLHTTGGMDNPSYVARDPDGKFLYVASESFEGLSSVLSYSINNDQSLTEISRLQTNGEANCHVHAFDGKLYSASYVSGNMDVYSIDDGKLTHERTIAYQGDGPNKDRQESAHAHQAMTSPDGQWLYVCDLGSDKIWRHKVGELKSEADGFTVVCGGSGPRHLAFHPTLPFAYVVGELNTHLIVCSYDATTGALEVVEELKTLPDDYTGAPAAAAVRVHPNGKALYFSNRQHNSVSTFSIDENGKLDLKSTQPSGGEEPRDIHIDPSGNYLLIANQDGDNISVYKLDPETGLPGAEIVHEFKCLTPVSIEF